MAASLRPFLAELPGIELGAYIELTCRLPLAVCPLGMVDNFRARSLRRRSSRHTHAGL